VRGQGEAVGRLRAPDPLEQELAERHCLSAEVRFKSIHKNNLTAM
jgi:hypothetical protein